MTNDQRAPERTNAQTREAPPSRASDVVSAFPRSSVKADRSEGERGMLAPSLRSCVLWFALAMLTCIALGVP